MPEIDLLDFLSQTTGYVASEWPAGVRAMIETHGLSAFIEACREIAVHECFASVFTIQERLKIDSYLKERQITIP